MSDSKDTIPSFIEIRLILKSSKKSKSANINDVTIEEENRFLLKLMIVRD